MRVLWSLVSLQMRSDEVVQLYFVCVWGVGGTDWLLTTWTNCTVAGLYQTECRPHSLQVYNYLCCSHLQIDKKAMHKAGMVQRVTNEVEIHCRLKHPSILEVTVAADVVFSFTTRCFFFFFFCHHLNLLMYGYRLRHESTFIKGDW